MSDHALLQGILIALIVLVALTGALLGHLLMIWIIKGGRGE